ncbi:hypothetical protein SAMN02787118_11441 [Streptomyces mirabilis]|jgi:hypothetical protein|uniref:Uncharacterized protein n=1 Tax=Streptomyces mirabilis TaxID=68239 RepID=A0A1I2MW91_9ACTN|nr:hypothetical protein SAMN02787118_11441 [Streptomyces mirabilis]
MPTRSRATVSSRSNCLIRNPVNGSTHNDSALNTPAMQGKCSETAALRVLRDRTASEPAKHVPHSHGAVHPPSVNEAGAGHLGDVQPKFIDDLPRSDVIIVINRGFPDGDPAVIFEQRSPK